jgi:GT2 family glycosyltransferase
VPDIVPDLVSTIIPVFNRPQMLREAVASVLTQTYHPIEVIIADDGSTDDTPHVAEELVRKYPELIVFVRKENSGPGPTREAGRLVARGEFIQYLDSDDLLRPRKFETQVRALRDRADCGAAYGYICLHPGDGPPKRTPYKESGKTYETLFPRLLADRWWNTDCPLFRRSVVDEVGPWTDLRWSQDWEYDGRVGALGTKLIHCKEFVCDQRQHTGQRQTSSADWMDPFRLRQRMRFLELMLQHAERAGVAPDTPERQHFTRWIFTTARYLAAVGLAQESQHCLELAERSAGDCSAAQKGFRVFSGACKLLGTRRAGGLFLALEKWTRPSRLTLEQSFAKVQE